MPVTVRDMAKADLLAVAALHVTTFNETHTTRNDGPRLGLREQQWSAAFESHPAEWFGVVIETGNGELVGFAKGSRHDGGIPGYEGELDKIYLLKHYHRRGLGRALLCRVAELFLERGMNSMLLFGDARSPSNRFYEAMGAERIISTEGDFHGSYGWRDLRALVGRCTGDGRKDEHMPAQTTRTSRFIHASPDDVFDAFLDPTALVAWLSPGDMTARVHNFDGRVGGGYEMSLFYAAAEPEQRGKTTSDEDRFTARFTVIERSTRIVEVITFDSADPAFAGAMTMDVAFGEKNGGTEVTIVFTDIPAGIRPEDNDAGTKSSLEKLAKYVEVGAGA